MGRDCSLFIFPPGRVPRECCLDRWYYMIPVYEALGINGWHDDRVPAHQMLSALLKLPPWEDSPERPHLTESAAHWRNVAIEYLHGAIERWGPDVPTMICDEGFAVRYYSPRSTLERLEQRKEYRARQVARGKAKRDKEESGIVYEWIAERRKNQWNDTPLLSFQDYLSQRKKLSKLT